MRELWMKVSDLKSAAILLDKYFTIEKLWGPSNEKLCIGVAKGATKLLEVKVGGPKKMQFFTPMSYKNVRLKVLTIFEWNSILSRA